LDPRKKLLKEEKKKEGQGEHSRAKTTGGKGEIGRKVGKGVKLQEILVKDEFYLL